MLEKTMIGQIAVAAIVVACSVAGAQASLPNWALPANGASYAHNTGWPGSPNAVADTAPPSKMNDEDFDTTIGSVNELLAFRFDLGQDRQITEINVFGNTWQWNMIASVTIHLRDEAAGDFNIGDFDGWDGQAQTSYSGLTFDKGQSPWLATTGAIDVTARYVAFETPFSADHQRLDEVEINGIPEPASAALLLLGLPLIRRRQG